jgi:SAM-dependent methyltransferase
MAQASYNADAYERGRPDYPRAAVDHLLQALAITKDDIVLDLAAGTGKFTKELVGTAGSVVAVEPDPPMRRELAVRLPKVEVLDGQATSIPLGDGSVDAVTVAQAFHWFANREALEEIARVLRPGRRLGLIWNTRDLSQPLHQDLEPIYDRHRKSTPNYRNSGWRSAFTADGPFGPLHEAQFRHVHPVDQGTLLALVTSVSYMSGLSDDERAGVEEKLSSVFAGHARPGDPPLVEVPYRTDVYWAELVAKT